MVDSAARVLLILSLGILALISANGLAYAATPATKKVVLGFKAKSLGKGGKFCVRIKNKWQAASSIKKGAAKLLPTTANTSHRKCQTEGVKFLKGATVYKTSATTISGYRPSNVGTKAAETFVRVGSTGTEYPYVITLPAAPNTLFLLPNGFTIIELANAPVTIAGVPCFYAKISATGVLGCLSGVKTIANSSVLSVKAGREFQPGPSDSVYFAGTNEAASSVLFKMSSSGAISEFYVAPALKTISGFSVRSEGSVAISFRVESTSDLSDPSYDVLPEVSLLSQIGAEQVLSTDVRTISGNKGLGWITNFADGRMYVGLTNFSGAGNSAASTAEIHRVTVALDALENYVRPSSDSICGGLSTGPLCGFGASLIRAAANTTSRSFVVAQEPLVTFPFTLTSSVVQLFPTLNVLSLSNISTPTGMAAVGDTLVVAGKNLGGEGAIVSYNILTASETVIRSGLVIGDGPYYSAKAGGFIAYGNDLSVTPATTYSIFIPATTEGVLGTPIVTSLDSPSSIGFIF